ncbi:MAG: chemotaxis protein CheX [Planctomycetota bacterium]
MVPPLGKHGDDMQPQVRGALIEAARVTLRRMLVSDLVATPADLAAHAPNEPHAIVRLSGGIDGHLTVSIPEATGSRMHAMLTGRPRAAREDVLDLIGELASTIAGRALTTLQVAHPSIGTPGSRESDVCMAAGTEHIRLRCHSDFGEFRMELEYAAPFDDTLQIGMRRIRARESADGPVREVAV